MELYTRGHNALNQLNRNFRRHDNSLARDVMANAKTKFDELCQSKNITDETITNFLKYVQQKVDQYDQRMEERTRQQMREERDRKQKMAEEKMEIEQRKTVEQEHYDNAAEQEITGLKIVKEEVYAETAEESIEDEPPRTIRFREDDDDQYNIRVIDYEDDDESSDDMTYDDRDKPSKI